MKNLLKYLVGLAFILMPALSNAQTAIAKDNPLEVEPGSNLLFVVVLVLCVLVIGVFVYLFSIDRKLKKMEKNI